MSTYNRRNSRASGITAATLATFVFSWGFILVKLLAMAPAAIAVFRVAIGAVVLGVSAVVLRYPWPRQWRLTIVAGLVFSLHQITFITATHNTSVAIVTLFSALQPLLIATVSRKTVGERVNPLFWGCALFAILGVVIVLHANLSDSSRSLYGDLFAGANLLLFASYFLLAKTVMQRGDNALTFTASFLAVSLFVLVPWFLLTNPVVPTTQQSLLLVLLALGPGNGHLLLNWAHQRISAAMAALVLAAIPLLSSIWAHLIFDEPFTSRHAVGIFMVACSVELGRRIDSRNQSTDSSTGR